MQRSALVSLASAGLIGLSLVVAGPIARALPDTGEPTGTRDLRVEGASHVRGAGLARRGVVLAVRSAEEDRQTRGGAAWLRSGEAREAATVNGPGYVVLARMGDGTIRRALFPDEPELRLGDSVKAAAGTLVACELYRSAPFLPTGGRRL